MKKGIIFDMDGVLVDSQPIHFEADIRTLAKNNVNVKQKDLEKYAGTSNESRWTLLKEEYNLSNPVDQLVDTQVNIISKLLDEIELQPIDGIVPLLSHLKEHHYALSVASSSSNEFIHKMLDKLKITAYFDFIVSGENMENGKPAPDIFLHTSKLMALEPSECVVIEDSTNGVLAAVRAKMKCIAYVNKSTGIQDLSPATTIVKNFHQVNQEMINNL